MADVETPKSLGSIVDEFTSYQADREREMERKRTMVARELLIRMAQGEDFGVKEFIFAASMGLPDKYEEQSKMIQKVEKLPKGNVVAVATAHCLGVIGVTGIDKPLVMEVETGGIEDASEPMFSRRLSASIIVGDFRFNRSARPHEFHTRAYGEGLTLANVLLNAPSEPYDIDMEAFYGPKQVIFGGREIVEFALRNDDRHGLMAVADLLNDVAAGDTF